MKVLKERILKDGKCYPGGILKVDKFINHQMDPNLMKDIAVEFIRRFASSKVNKIITIEASGIAPAIMMGFLMNLPVVFAKKKKPSTMDNMLTTKVTSFTKQRDYDVIISKDYLTPDDHVIFVDDFLANGNAAKGIIDLCRQRHKGGVACHHRVARQLRDKAQGGIADDDHHLGQSRSRHHTHCKNRP